VPGKKKRSPVLLNEDRLEPKKNKLPRKEREKKRLEKKMAHHFYSLLRGKEKRKVEHFKGEKKRKRRRGSKTAILSFPVGKKSMGFAP